MIPTKYYYGAIRPMAPASASAYCGYVYHYDETGKREIEDYRSTGVFESRVDAMFDAFFYVATKGLDARMDKGLQLSMRLARSKNSK